MSNAGSSGILDLAWFGLTEFPEWIVKKVPELKCLVLTGNKLTWLPGTLVKVASLQTILLTSNKMVSLTHVVMLQPRPFPHLIVLRVSAHVSKSTGQPASASHACR